ncbi:hypothetical protein ABUW04_31980 [Streptacidiphilus sp. N1-10]|uniref:ApeA N-terminal domain-containing protein n=1 Tax=Streptacidiphilus jeojiensis TaxID=3229225 RepID=A0ABV6XXN3_9ACTN
MTVTLTTRNRLLLRADITHSPEGFTYYAVRAPQVRGTLTVHPEAAPGHRDDPDAYTGLCITFGTYDPAASPSAYADRTTVYGSPLYGSVSVSAEGTRDPWGQVHRNPYELAEAPSRDRIKDICEAVIAYHRTSLDRHRQHAAYLRHQAPKQLDRITDQADHLRSSARALARYEALQARWAVLGGATDEHAIDVTMVSTLANWLDQRFAGHPAVGAGEQELYLAWTAAVRLNSRHGIEQSRRINLPSVQSTTALIHHLTHAAAHAPGRVAPAAARATLRRLAARRSGLAHLITIPAQRRRAA